ncbi:tetratricopeptide repeat protein [Roseiconus nitratireducens]|uniref:Tetratricopeptide repeat protein n=1 Tax=Roseiconus nitratireducens TaxID=2605748 RepID=A0A5M6DI28_9BACT|nr:tetratricopeptide repeat protein [Roseiconus nitratireducens]KAA5545922.1 tetratricopeptide repeat protein [Roseiconus nitratireducens]
MSQSFLRTPFGRILLTALASISLSFATGRLSVASAQEATADPPAAETTEQESGEGSQTADTDAPSDAAPKESPGELSLDLDTTPADPGQNDLDEAAILRFEAKSQRELQAVERLLQSAVKKGLTGENAAFAKKMLGSVLLQKSQQLIAAMGQAGGNRPLALRDEALSTLEEAIKNDPELVEGYLLIARLNMLPGGDKQAITDATTKAIEILKDNPVERSAALVLRALTWGPGEDEKRMEDLNAAVRDDPENLEALRARAALRLQQDDVGGAIEDLELVLTKDPTNERVAQTVVQQLAEMDRVDDALELLSKALEAEPSEGLYRMRAILYRMQLKEDEALADLNKALAMQPKDPLALLSRAEIAISRQDVQAAKNDLRAAERIAPQVAGVEQAIFVRCLIAIEEGRMADAINEMKTLISRDPENAMRQLQLANLYLQDERPRKAIEVLTTILDRDPTNVSVLRSRADALLSVGEHREAINDYERALKAAGDDNESFDLSGLLNNLAWVLATSPQEGVRNGERAVELANRAVDLSQGEEPHILSTLAAAYAEAGDFDKAVEWSTKAVELGKQQEHHQIEQLEGELESYRAGKPWREKQETEENDVPILSPDDLIDT